MNSKYLITNDGLKLNPEYKEEKRPEEKKHQFPLFEEMKHIEERKWPKVPENIPEIKLPGSEPPKDWKGWLKLAGCALVHVIFPEPEEKPKPPPGPTYTVTRHNDGALTVTIRP